MLSAKHYLEQMGIEIWRCRDRLPSQQYYFYQLFSQEQCQALLLADVNLNNAAEQQLVEKIAAATNRKISGGVIENITEISLKEVPVVILLGQKIATQITVCNQACMTSYSAAELLQTPALKAETWRVLKRAIKIMDNYANTTNT